MKKTILNSLVVALLFIPAFAAADTDTFVKALNERDVSYILGSDGQLTIFGEQDFAALCQLSAEHDASVTEVVTSATDDSFAPLNTHKCN